jgi:hypothetical protein
MHPEQQKELHDANGRKWWYCNEQNKYDSLKETQVGTVEEWKRGATVDLLPDYEAE